MISPIASMQEPALGLLSRRCGGDSGNAVSVRVSVIRVSVRVSFRVRLLELGY